MIRSSNHAVLAGGILAILCSCRTSRGDDLAPVSSRATAGTGVISIGRLTQITPAQTTRRWRRQRRRRESQREQVRDHVFDSVTTDPATAISDCLSNVDAFATDERVQVVSDALSVIESDFDKADWKTTPFVEQVSEVYPVLEKLTQEGSRLPLPASIQDRIDVLIARSRAMCACYCTAELKRLTDDESWNQACARSISLRESIPSAVLSDVQPLLEFVSEFGCRREAANLLRVRLSDKSLDQWRAPIDLQFGELPVEVRDPVHALQTLAEVQHTVEAAEALNIARFLERIGPQEQSPEFRDQVLRLRQSVSFHLFLDGDAADARRVLPESGDRSYFQAILHDIKTIAAGAGELETWPARRHLIEHSDDTSAIQRKPSGSVELITPIEAAVTQFSITSDRDRPLWENWDTFETPLREQIENSADRWISPTSTKTLHRATENAMDLYQRRIERFDLQERSGDMSGEEPCLEAVRRRMRRNLSLDEEFLARRLCLEGQLPPDVVDAIEQASQMASE